MRAVRLSCARLDIEREVIRARKRLDNAHQRKAIILTRYGNFDPGFVIAQTGPADEGRLALWSLAAEIEELSQANRSLAKRTGVDPSDDAAIFEATERYSLPIRRLRRTLQNANEDSDVYKVLDAQMRNWQVQRLDAATVLRRRWGRGRVTRAYDARMFEIDRLEEVLSRRSAELAELDERAREASPTMGPQWRIQFQSADRAIEAATRRLETLYAELRLLDSEAGDSQRVRHVEDVGRPRRVDG